MRGLPKTVIDQKTAVRRPTGGTFSFARLVEQFLGSLAIWSLMVQLISSAPVGGENDAPSIRRPCGECFPTRIGRESRRLPAGDFVYPDVPVLGLRICALKGDSPPVRRNSKRAVQTRLSGRT